MTWVQNVVASVGEYHAFSGRFPPLSLRHESVACVQPAHPLLFYDPGPAPVSWRHGSMLFRKILVRATNWIGDAVMSLPALQALRAHHPEARITLLARPWVADLYGREPFCDEVVPYQAPRGAKGIRTQWRIAFDLRERAFACAILLPSSFESALVVHLAKRPVRIGYRRDARGWLLSRAVPVP